jgi:hypothetical protein
MSDQAHADRPHWLNAQKLRPISELRDLIAGRLAKETRPCFVMRFTVNSLLLLVFLCDVLFDALRTLLAARGQIRFKGRLQQLNEE